MKICGMKIQSIACIMTVLLLTGCQKNIPAYFPPSHKILVMGDTLVYDGMITGDAVLEAMRIIRNSDSPIRRLKIKSVGGDMAVGIEFGYFIKENDIDVEIDQLCFSSCANYIIPAAKNLVINNNSFVAWHGGATQSDELWKLGVPIDQQSALMSYVKLLRKKESAYFSYVGVDPKITTYGQIIKNSCQANEKTDGWYYSIDDLHSMGIKNITSNDSHFLTEIVYKAEVSENSHVKTNENKITSCLLVGF